MALRTRWLGEVLGGAVVLVAENAVPVLVEMVGSPVASVREVEMVLGTRWLGEALLGRMQGNRSTMH